LSGVPTLIGVLKDRSISPSFGPAEGVAKGPLMYNGVWSENKLKSLAFGSSFNATKVPSPF
jgi:hypothetical protein